MERRFITHEFRVSESDQATTIQGYAAVFDSPGQGYYWIEELDPHCFDAVLASNPDVRALFNHDPNFVLGRTTANTLSLSVDGRGLSYSCSPPDTTYANDLLVSMRRKDITGSSFGFVVARDQWTDNADGTITRRILEIDQLLDVSPVTYPAYDAANSQVRSIPESMPAEFRSRIEQREMAKPAELVKHEEDQRLNLLTRLALEETS
jgi:HK97 family phage prohead protease